jgi:predicted Holliday junction resolvase-like endonuclease
MPYGNSINDKHVIHKYIQADINDYSIDEYNAITENKYEDKEKEKDENLKHNEYIDKKIEECRKT